LKTRLVLAHQLKTWGAKVQTASSAYQALNILNEQAQLGGAVDAVFIDSCLEDIEGATLGQSIRQQSKFDDIKLVMMTPIGNKGDANHFA